MRMSREFIERVTASNGSVFTGPGTNSYLIGKEDITLVDPGPKIDAHIENLIRLGEGKIKRILVTHTHRDHSPAAKVLGEILNVPLMGRLLEKDDSLQDRTFKPEFILKHGDLIETNEYTIETVHTPGHASNHLCYLIQEEKVMLTGDHIMNGSTVVIAHPDGSMKDYLSSLELLRNYNFNKIGPGHGDFLGDPMAVVDWIIDHRLEREKKVISKLKLFSTVTSKDLVASVYDDVDSKLHPIAIWSLEAHLYKLLEDGMVEYNSTDKIWSFT
ncbi:MAG: MBL fold metallo-hydrolase [Gammaproteobacteria bacterium TMED236]|nr:MAG: MBL fold metallo-hydrolase [Gammaproteobacteria bacterium TMED236]